MLGWVNKIDGEQVGSERTVDQLLRKFAWDRRQADWAIVCRVMSWSTLVYWVDNCLFPWWWDSYSREGGGEEDCVWNRQCRGTFFQDTWVYAVGARRTSGVAIG